MDGYTTGKYRSRLPQLTVIKNAQPKVATICPSEHALILFNNGPLYQSEFERRDYIVEITIFLTYEHMASQAARRFQYTHTTRCQLHRGQCDGRGAQNIFQAEPWRN